MTLAPAVTLWLLNVILEKSKLMFSVPKTVTEVQDHPFAQVDSHTGTSLVGEYGLML
jgi:hypothetical protein